MHVLNIATILFSHTQNFVGSDSKSLYNYKVQTTKRARNFEREFHKKMVAPH